MTDLPDWDDRLVQSLSALSGQAAGSQAFLAANGQAVARALTGRPVDGGSLRPGTGGCVVVNISSAHIPTLTRPDATYKNCYDLDADNARLGEVPTTSPKRQMVDAALEPLHGHPADRIYFAAIEFNGCGVGFYGDCCLVLEDDVTEKDVIVLDRNSYDLIREPLSSAITAAAGGRDETEARTQEAARHAGRMNAHLAAIATIKVLEARQPVLRLVTTGAVSEGVLDDEDYIEVLRPGTFGMAQVREVRLAPAEVALDERIRGRSLVGQPPSQAEALWRDRRRTAEARLRGVNVPVRVVTTAGRTKG